MTLQSGVFGLYGLRPAYLKTPGRGVGVERHVLGLEGCRLVAILKEYPAEGGSDDALSYLAPRAGKHNGS
jgi:hypothetical protein